MNGPDVRETLSRIKTQWTLLGEAHEGKGDEARKILHQQLLRYYGAVYRYLLGVVCDVAVAEDLTQDFAVRFLRGDFKGARRNFEGGHRPGASFRNYLRTALRNLARDYWDRQKQRDKEGGPLPADDRGPAADWDRIFDDSCRDDVLDQAYQALAREEQESWLKLERQDDVCKAYQALAREEQESGTLYYTVLNLKTRQPELTAPQMAERLARQLGRPFNAAAIRKTLQRARDRFAELLLDELSRRLGTSELDDLEQELSDLNLLVCCQPALHRRRAASS
ncbi:MAG: sigma-70 family RNA polymerase sigma factor [Planctomycetes bacterium]|nr:sigma-70 family RNA polymerase sigma factor [Planctomycetota bacterium]